MQEKEADDYLTEQAVANRFKVSVSTVKGWRQRNIGPAYYKLGGAIRYKPEDVDSYERESRVEPIKGGGDAKGN